MVSSVAVICLLAAAFLGGAFSLTCFHCNTTGPNCELNDKVCDAKLNTCITTITEIRPEKTTAKSATKQLVKSCGYKTDCNQNYSMSLNATYLRASTKCCDGDKCKTELFDLPQRDTNDNKKKCLSCNEPTSACKNPITINCIGEEKSCISYIASDGTSDAEFKLQGCATDNLCSMKNVSILPFNQILKTQFHCNHAPPLLPSMLLPVGFVLVMLKLLS